MPDRKPRRPLLDMQHVHLIQGAELAAWCGSWSDADRERARDLVRRRLGRRGLAWLGIQPVKRGGGVLLNADENPDLQAQIIKLTRASEAEARKLTAALQDGTLTADEWYRAMLENLRALYLACAELARGTEDEDNGALLILAGLLATQIQYLNHFAAGLADGSIPLDGRAIIRAGLYALAGYGIYEAMRRTEMTRAGYTQERRVLGAAEHCGDCVEYADRGWQPIGTLPPIGDSQCLTNCHCRFEYSGQVNL